MKHHLPPLDSFKVFEAAGKHLSFSKAADELCLTKGAVSYQIRRLEQDIDTLLFRRTVRQVYLTDAGQLLLHSIQKVFQDLNVALAQLNPQSGYDVSIAATTYVAARWLSPRVAKFLEQNPETSIQFDHSVNNGQFSLDNVDLAVVWGKCDGPMDIHTLMQIPMPLFPVGNPGLANSLQQQPGSLKHTTLLYENRRQDLWLEWFGAATLENPIQVIEDANVRVQAAIDGQGLMLADAMMQTELTSGLLIAPFEKTISGYGYLLKSAGTNPVRTTAAAMINWLMQDFEATSEAF